MADPSGPFHAGELEAQRLAEVGDVASWAGGFLRDHMPDQHRAFFSDLPFLIVAGGDAQGRPWVTILDGPDGFVTSPDPWHLRIGKALPAGDPLAGALEPGDHIGLLGIEMSTRRRNRMNGRIGAADQGLAIEVQQSFGNCPQYIREREWYRAEDDGAPPQPRVTARLDAEQAAHLSAAETFFIGTGSFGEGGAIDGYDASHRGGPPGFVLVTDDGKLRIPDYSGNNYFNTIGNLLRDPRVGLVFPEFETGRLIQITGRARIEWTPEHSHDPNARRMVEITVDEVIDRPRAIALRWRRETAGQLQVVDKVVESDRITSFYLAPIEGAALAPFRAGQHLPVELQVPGQPDRVARSYSLSGAPGTDRYRISVKREDRGIASGHLHDGIRIGARIGARAPSGDFVLPDGDGPVVLVSAGVGVTPMIAALHAAADRGGDRPIWFVHTTRDGAAHAFRDEVATLVETRPNIRTLVHYTRPRAQDRIGSDFDREGRFDAKDLLALDAGPDADYLLCGPGRFLADLRDGLEAGGVSPDRIHFETFGPAG